MKGLSLRDLTKALDVVGRSKKKIGIKVIKLRKILFILLIFIFLISGCTKSKPEYKVSDGVYESEENSLVYIQFDVENEEFTFVHTSYSSYLPHGNFECIDGKITAKDEKETYIFEILDDETIVFINDGSTEIPVEDQTIFRLDKD